MPTTWLNRPMYEDSVPMQPQSAGATTGTSGGAAQDGQLVGRDLHFVDLLFGYLCHCMLVHPRSRGAFAQAGLYERGKLKP